MADYPQDWQNFVFNIGTAADTQEVCEHVRKYFLTGEPLNLYLGWSEDNAKDHDRLIQVVLTHGISFVVRAKASSELVGVHLVMDRRNTFSFGPSEEEKNSANFTKILKCITQVIAEADWIFQRDYHCNFYAEIFITSIAEQHRGCGLGKEMYKRMLPFLKSKGFPVIRSTFTSPKTRNIARGLGFHEMHRIYFKDQKDEQGRKLFPLAADGNEEFINDTAIVL